MPQPADFLAAYVILTLAALVGCGVCVIGLIALGDMIRIEIKRRKLRNARR